MKKVKGVGSGCFYKQRGEVSRDFTAHDWNFDISVGRGASEWNFDSTFREVHVKQAVERRIWVPTQHLL
jgi:hypothetical protein